MKLSYNTNGLRNMTVEQAISEVGRFGYNGIEISLHTAHFNPLLHSNDKLDSIKKYVKACQLEIANIATGCADLLSDEPYEPSLIAPDPDGRKRRIALIRKSIEAAKYLAAPVVNFASGLKNPALTIKDARSYLIEGIKACLKNAGEVVLALEPEPNMFIETTSQAISIIKEIGSPNLRLNLDIGHAYCCEENYLEKIASALKYARHVHVEDIKNRVHHHEIPGTGEINFKKIILDCKNSGYSGFLSVELYHHADVWEEALGKSQSYLSNMIKSIYHG